MSWYSLNVPFLVEASCTIKCREFEKRSLLSNIDYMAKGSSAYRISLYAVISMQTLADSNFGDGAEMHSNGVMALHENNYMQPVVHY